MSTGFLEVLVFEEEFVPFPGYGLEFLPEVLGNDGLLLEFSHYLIVFLFGFLIEDIVLELGVAHCLVVFEVGDFLS